MLTNALRRTDSRFIDAALARQMGQVVPLRGRAPLFTSAADRNSKKSLDFAVEVFPPEAVKRRRVSWNGIAAEILRSTEAGAIEIRFGAPAHLLIFSEQGSRSEGETRIEGLPSSSLRDLRRKLTFVPAGHAYRDRQVTRGTMRIVCLYLDPNAFVEEGAGLELSPRLFFEDAALLETVAKLAGLIERPEVPNRAYGEALGAVLMQELARLEGGVKTAEAPVKGGLAAWQERTVLAHIEEHLDEKISLAALASLARLSPYYFCRAFKQSFGVPPHRFHTQRRIERAKELLAKPEPSVTQIGLVVGFSETSSFTAAFRKATGLTPTAYHRSLI